MSDLPLETRRDFLQTLMAGSSALALGGSLTQPAFAFAPAKKSGGLIVRQKLPLNAEPGLPELSSDWMTPTELFYIRNHAPTPKVDAKSFSLSVEGFVKKPLKLSLAELTRRFERTEVTATMTCAGNRRYEHSKVKKVGSVQWQEGAIGNARWSGVRLSDVLKAAGLQPGAKHIWFDGLDEIGYKETTINFGGSIPIEKAMLDTKSMPGAIVCDTMNGKPLTPDHGYPLRTVVPGYIGARSVKWLGRIVVSDRPSPNHYVADAYKVVTEGTKLEIAEQAPIYGWPINSVICNIKTTGGDRVRVSGYALPSGKPGATIKSVELSADGGRHWTPAKLTTAAKEYCWTLWSGDITVRPNAAAILVRCTDSTGETQPQTVPWNQKGYMYNAWHHVPLGKK